MADDSRIRIIVLLSALALLAACGTDDAASEEQAQAGTSDEEVAGDPDDDAAEVAGNLTDECAPADAEGDLFVDKVAFDEATGVTVDYHDDHKLVEVTIPDTGEALTYALVQCGTDGPEDLDEGAQVIEVPVATVATMTTANVPHLAALDVVDRLVGVANGGFITTPEVAERVGDGEVPDLADDSGTPDDELLLGADPGVVFIDAFGPGVADDVARLGDLGIPAVPNADFDESSLLARAEWVKFTSLFFNTEAAAEAEYTEIASSYQAIADLAADADATPRVLTEQPFEGTWYVPGGESLAAVGITDAGGEYVFDHISESGSTGLDIETVLDTAADADVWLAAGSVTGALDDLVAQDERFSAIQAVDEENVWAIDVNLSPGGGYPIYEEAYARADHYLADLVAILHPELMPDHELRYFGQVGSEVDPDGDADA